MEPAGIALYMNAHLYIDERATAKFLDGACIIDSREEECTNQDCVYRSTRVLMSSGSLPTLKQRCSCIRNEADDLTF